MTPQKEQLAAPPAALVPVYFFTDLSEDAQKKVIERERCEGHHIDLDFIEYDIKDALKMLGFTDIKIYYDISYSQGSGACFIADDYRYIKGAAAAIKTEFTNWTALHDIAQRLQEIQRQRFYKLRATITHNNSHYYHENSTTAQCSIDYSKIDCAEFNDVIIDLNYLIYKTLLNEYEYQNSDEQIADFLSMNCYTYTAKGEQLCY